MYESPVERLSVLIDALNQRFGLNLTEADKIWFEQKKQAIKEDDNLRVIELTNDRTVPARDVDSGKEPKTRKP